MYRSVSVVERRIGMPARQLSREAARRGTISVRAELGQADRPRLDALLAAMGDDGRIRLKDAIDGLFPGRPRETALALFRQFRERLGAAATDATLTLALEVDGQNRAKPEDRSCWFAGDDGAAAAAARLSDADTADATRNRQDAV